MPARLTLVALALAAGLAGCKKVSSAGAGAAAGAAAGAVGPAPAPSGAALEAADARMRASAELLVRLFSGVTDEASARAAAPQIRAACPELAASGKLRLQLIAALLLAKQNAPVDAVLERNAREMDQMPKEKTLLGQLERVAKGPHGPLLRAEINAVIDAIMEGLPTRPRAQLEEQLRRDGVRQ
jgi:hypothetical protein